MPALVSVRSHRDANGPVGEARRPLGDEEEDDPVVVRVAERSAEDRLEAVDDVLDAPGRNIANVDP